MSEKDHFLHYLAKIEVFMGGKGSSRWRNYEKKETVESCQILDVSPILKDPCLKKISPYESVYVGIRWIRNKNGAVIASYGIFDDRIPAKARCIKIPLTRTKTQLKGTRWWFQCPIKKVNKSCMIRAQKLYRPLSSGEFGCRRCHKLTYLSSQESYRTKKIRNILKDYVLGG